MSQLNRRKFIKTTTMTGIGVGMLFSPARLFGYSPNETVNVAVIGLNGRGQVLLQGFNSVPNSRVVAVCDVDQQVLDKAAKKGAEQAGRAPKAEIDFRRLLEDPDVDAVAIATPDHWHAPMAIMALQAGKHVYVEKPCSHNPHEGELLVRAQEKYGKVVQMGNQQRSGPTSIQAIADIRNGVIGKPYLAKAWYTNKRGPIGKGKEAPVPAHLNYELWQGPAPRQPYRDNLIHYNWHWFWNWGTGEILNNGTHEIDICRWALGVTYPDQVASTGGRYHFDDDWQFWDTQVVNYDYGANGLITWEGRSCNPGKVYDRDRGSAIYGTEGTVIVDRNKYELFDLDGKLVKSLTEQSLSETTGTLGGGNLDDLHFINFLGGIREGKALHSPIAEGNISVNLCHLGNIAQAVGHNLEIDRQTGKVKGDKAAMKYWEREYAKGWEPKV